VAGRSGRSRTTGDAQVLRTQGRGVWWVGDLAREARHERGTKNCFRFRVNLFLNVYVQTLSFTSVTQLTHSFSTLALEKAQLAGFPLLQTNIQTEGDPPPLSLSACSFSYKHSPTVKHDGQIKRHGLFLSREEQSHLGFLFVAQRDVGVDCGGVPCPSSVLPDVVDARARGVRVCCRSLPHRV